MLNRTFEQEADDVNNTLDIIPASTISLPSVSVEPLTSRNISATTPSSSSHVLSSTILSAPSSTKSPILIKRNSSDLSLSTSAIPSRKKTKVSFRSISFTSSSSDSLAVADQENRSNKSDTINDDLGKYVKIYKNPTLQ